MANRIIWIRTCWIWIDCLVFILYIGLFITRGRLIDDNSIVKILRV